MKFSTSLAAAFFLFQFSLQAQTYVSGGIYNNTTWTLANSPYIVTDTIVVFPGITLTVEPGVTIKFDDGKYMQIRQGSFIAAGTASDSITITSNSSAPFGGIYKGIVFTNPAAVTFDYCIFKYADAGFTYCCNTLNSVAITHSSFYYNNVAFSDNYSNVYINDCSFYSNHTCFPYTPYLLSIKNSIFQDNTYCIGDNISSGADNFTADSSSFINSFLVVYCGRSSRITNCIFSGNYWAVRYDDNLGFGLYVDHSIFCSNQYGINMTYNSATSTDTLMHCSFSQNGTAVSGEYRYMTDNVISDNNTGVAFSVRSTDSIFSNYIFRNQIGITYSGGASASFFQNYICNNSGYNINYTSTLNGTIPPVCYCDSDSASIRAKIYDGYTDITRGLLDFTPYIQCDSSTITALAPVNCPPPVITAVENNFSVPEPDMHVYPNPASEEVTVSFHEPFTKAAIRIFNITGGLMYRGEETGKGTIDVSAFENGVYMLEAISAKTIIRQKFIVEK